MLFSKSFIPTQRQAPKGAECTSHALLLKSGYLFMVSSGIYSYLPLGLKVLRKIEMIIRREMNSAGAHELFMSALQPLEAWKKTGRDQTLAEVMIRFTDKRGRELCLGPTHEEEITEIAKRYISSYKQLPVILYQIQTKFRDETRPRFGLIRSCEFIMKDAYSFDADDEGLDASYEKMFDAYKAIFASCGLTTVITEADSGAMGGDFSHEFMVPAPIGEDVLYHCSACNRYEKKPGKCSQCGAARQEIKAIEVGHVFKLGTKYSQALGASFLDQEGKLCPVIMGCYGIGTSRLLPAIIEQNSDKKGIIWPKNVSCFDASLLILERDNISLFGEAMRMYQLLIESGFDVLFDDRNEAAGVKFNDAYLIGSPFIIIVGKKFAQTKRFELEIRRTGEKHILNEEELLNFMQGEYGKRK